MQVENEDVFEFSAPFYFKDGRIEIHKVLSNYTSVASLPTVWFLPDWKSQNKPLKPSIKPLKLFNVTKIKFMLDLNSNYRYKYIEE